MKQKYIYIYLLIVLPWVTALILFPSKKKKKKVVFLALQTKEALDTHKWPTPRTFQIIATSSQILVCCLLTLCPAPIGIRLNSFTFGP